MRPLNKTATATSFGTAFRRLAELDPDRPMLTCQGQTLSRAELVSGAVRLADRLRQLGVRPGSLVSINLPNSVELVTSVVAAWWLGATPQPLSHSLAPIERDAILDLARPALIVGTPEATAGRRGPTLTLEDVHAALRSTTDPSPLDPEVPAQWKALASGGSTGRPKLIVSEQPALYEQFLPLSLHLRLPTDGCVVVPGPACHNGPFSVLMLSLLRGNHTILMRRFEAEETLRLVQEHRASWLYLVPTMMHRIWRLPEREKWDVSGLDTVCHMAAPCPPWLKRAWIDWVGAGTVLELYGSTEGQALTVVDGAEWLTRPGTVGRPVVGEIEVRDPAGAHLPRGETGELWMRRAPGVSTPYRYLGATARRDGQGWESLGDMGHLDSDGYLFLADRQADMLLVGGSNVYPAEVEAALDEHPAVRSSAVIGLPDTDLGNAPHAIVELATPVTDADLVTYLRERLAPYKVPRSIERTDRPLRDDAGKLRRSALRAARIPSG